MKVSVLVQRIENSKLWSKSKKEGRSRDLFIDGSSTKLFVLFSPLKDVKKLLKEVVHLELQKLCIKLFIWFVVRFSILSKLKNLNNWPVCSHQQCDEYTFFCNMSKGFNLLDLAPSQKISPYSR